MWVYLAKVTFSIFTVLLIVFGGYFGYHQYQERDKLAKVKDFKTCAQAGYQIAIGSPLICRTPDGRVFKQKVSDAVKTYPTKTCVRECKNGICTEIACL